ncbi:MAG: hypothetical protein HYX79_06080 [Chloroflexi bacterium]|nr:hypothetical protein [Chloroflexota bacterium]
MGTPVDRDTSKLLFSPPVPGCVLFLPGLPEGGSKLHDRSSYGTPGTITGATWTKASGGLSCLHFDGIDDYASLAHRQGFNITRGTLMAWVKGNGTAIQKGGSASGSASSPYWIQVTPASKLLLHIGNMSDYDQIAANTVVDTTIWNLIAATLDGAAKKLYLNGRDEPWTAIRGTGSRTPNTNGEPLYTGRQQFSGGAHYADFNGDIAAQWVFKDIVFSPLQIQGYFEQTKRLFGRM